MFHHKRRRAWSDTGDRHRNGRLGEQALMPRSIVPVAAVFGYRNRVLITMHQRYGRRAKAGLPVREARPLFEKWVSRAALPAVACLAPVYSPAEAWPVADAASW